MLFQTQVFLLGFLPVTVALWYGLAERTVAREWCLLICSLVFYAWWDVRFVPLLVLQGGLSWLAAEIFQRRAKRVTRSEFRTSADADSGVSAPSPLVREGWGGGAGTDWARW